MTQAQALKILKTGANVFLTGEPGSGKTYTINQYVAYLEEHGIEPAITASTGIAATHIGGMTIHSWSGIGIKNRLSSHELNNIVANDYVQKRVGSAKVLIVDEISMLGPETLQMIDLVCREVKKNSRPFGGVQVVLVGDFFQLPPVRSTLSQVSQDSLFEEAPARFAYDSSAWKQAELITCYLTEQHRQLDKDLVSILTKIRSNDMDSGSLRLLGQRKVKALSTPEFAPKLYTHNFDVDAINSQMLAQIPVEQKYYPMSTKGHEVLIKAMKKGCLSPENLYLKIGASVMFTKNNLKEGYVNGTLGVVEGFHAETEFPIVKIRSGRKITLTYADWVVEEDGKVKGRLSQIPLRLAWAITVHKSQGISLDEAIIDLSKVFEFGQGYVALSRVRRLSGIYLLGWNNLAFQVDQEVSQKDKEFRLESADAENILANIQKDELRKMMDDFILRSDGVLEFEAAPKPKKKPKKVSTHEQTLKLWNQEKAIHEIAVFRGLSEKTVLGHIEELVNEGKINQAELVRSLPPALIKDLKKIHLAFRKFGEQRLTPVYEYFKGKYTYDDLRFARVVMDKN